ncbi:MAG: amidohydrolase family protein, partial [Parvularcula sp.]|jgi:imidazolonepropionase-like amidohydrolase|nr:amidohydrolase family protein [Parvularcula sp.]
MAGELADRDIPVITAPLLNLPSSFETMASDETGPQRLAEAGVDIAFFDPGTGFTHNARLLPQLAGNAVAGGMDHTAAMRAVTLVPARIFGLDRELGTLERGKLADVVIWNGDPFELSSRPSHVFVEGNETSLDNRQSRLARRYRDLIRGDLPVQYRND